MRLLLSLILLCTFAVPALAQRDPPVFDSYLARTVVCNQRTTLDFEITWHKGGGPHEQSTHAQMVVLLYLEKDEQKILELANQPQHTNKENKAEDLILAVLEKQKLATVLKSSVAELDKSNATADLKKLRGGYDFDFEFSFEYSQLLEKHKLLASFDKESVDTHPTLGSTYGDKVKLIIYVPTNDSPLATLIPEKLRKFYDFAHPMNMETSIHYFKPLPQSFQFREIKPGDVVACID